MCVCSISHPSDEKDHSLFNKNISAANMAALMDKHSGQSEPSVNVTNHREADGDKSKVKKQKKNSQSAASATSVYFLSAMTCFLL